MNPTPPPNPTAPVTSPESVKTSHDALARTMDPPARAIDPSTLSPAMRQYHQFKALHPGYVLFFRMGDFYEMFWEDAKVAARTLGVALTARSKGDDAIPMAGVPFHAVEGYLRKMIAAGHKVAICEQTEVATPGKLVNREVTRLMTPGTLTDEPLLEGRTDNFLAAVAFGVSRVGGYRAALAWVELSTGEVSALSGTERQVLDELARLRPAEVCVPELSSGQTHEIGQKILTLLGLRAITARPGWQFTAHHAREQVQKQWGARGTGGFGFDDDDPAVFATAALLSYLEETQKTGLSHLRPLRRHVVDDYLCIDPASYRSLEIDRTVRSGTTEGSLLSTLDQTRTTMGGRMLRQWLRYPLCDLDHIVARQNAIAALLDAPTELRAIVALMTDVCDIERVVARLAVARVGPRDLSALGRCMTSMPKLFDTLGTLARCSDVAPELSSSRAFCEQQANFLNGAILPEPAPHLREGGVINHGFDPELDRLRLFSTDSGTWLSSFQQRCVGESGIASLKVGFNRVFGYYIEVTNLHKDKVPGHWVRKQTTTNAERYITDELKKFEAEALGAQDRSVALEQRLFEQVRQALLPHVPALQELAGGLARLDVLASLATLAAERRYCRPSVVNERVLHIVDGRHPVLEKQLGNEFVANDVRFDTTDSLQLITGPNMAGKSTFIRQVALITLLAQVGSYVPARQATVGLVDRLFTRIGASDELHSGQSTFMVEMTETANILNNATDRSLVILDEIGRGTSTLDGLSLAWAIAEHIAGVIKCRTLFATHYHELTDLSERFRGVKNLNVAVREWEDQVIFLHRIVEGGTDRSYGIHVARLAGVPKTVLERSKQLLSELAVQHVGQPRISRSKRSDREINDGQLTLFVDPSKELHQTLIATKVDTLTPMQAFDLLRQWKEKYGK